MISRRIWIKSNQKRKGSPYKTMKVLLWIGAILSPIILAGSFGPYGPAGAIAFFVNLALSIPTAILTHHAINAAESKDDLVLLAAFALAFCSIIAGAMILCSGNDKWEVEKDQEDENWRFGK